MGKTIILNGSITDSITGTKANTNTQVDIHIDGKKITTINTNKGTYRYVLTITTHKNIYLQRRFNIRQQYANIKLYKQQKTQYT